MSVPPPKYKFNSSQAKAKSTNDVENVLKKYYAIFGRQCTNEFGANLDDDYDFLIEELECPSGINECVILDFDFFDNFPLYPNIDRADDNAVMEERFRIIASIVMTMEVPRATNDIDDMMNPNDLILKRKDITQKYIKISNAIYLNQTPDIFETCGGEPDIMYLLAAGCKNNFPVMQCMNDAFSRCRIDSTYYDKRLNSSVSTWFFATDFVKDFLKDQNDFVKKENKRIIESIESGIKGWSNRICPSIMFRPSRVVDDEPAKIASYIASVSELIITIMSNQNGAIPPFQVDIIIATKESVNAFDIDDRKDDDDDDYDSDDDDAKHNTKKIGDIHERLNEANCLFISDHDEILDDAKYDNLADVMVDLYKRFHDKLIINKSKNKHPHPHRKRFNIFIDRRNDTKKDEIIFFEPPSYCDTIPPQYVPEWFFESSRKALIPGPPDPDDIKNLDINVTNAFGFNDGEILTFSFHVEKLDRIRCYMFFNCQVHRFYPEDIIKVFKFIFLETQYHKFIASGDAEKIAPTIRIVDKQFEKFYVNLMGKYTIFPDLKRIFQHDVYKSIKNKPILIPKIADNQDKKVINNKPTTTIVIKDSITNKVDFPSNVASDIDNNNDNTASSDKDPNDKGKQTVQDKQQTDKDKTQAGKDQLQTGKDKPQTNKDDDIPSQPLDKKKEKEKEKERKRNEKKKKKKEFQSFLEKIQCEDHFDTFIKEGIGSIDGLALCEVPLLKMMGIPYGDGLKILDQYNKVKLSQNTTLTDKEKEKEFKSFLEKIECGEYYHIFIKEKMFSLDKLEVCEATHLRIIGIPLGDALKILQEYKKIKKNRVNDDQKEDLKEIKNPLVLCIGISQYDDASGYGNLTDVVGDIREYDNVLKNLYGYTLIKNDLTKSWNKKDIQKFLYLQEKKIITFNKILDDIEYNYDALIVTISSHGGAHCIITSDGDELTYDDIQQQFMNYPLTTIPRYFWIDACRDLAAKVKNTAHRGRGGIVQLNGLLTTQKGKPVRGGKICDSLCNEFKKNINQSVRFYQIRRNAKEIVIKNSKKKQNVVPYDGYDDNVDDYVFIPKKPRGSPGSNVKR